MFGKEPSRSREVPGPDQSARTSITWQPCLRSLNTGPEKRQTYDIERNKHVAVPRKFLTKP
jgi:hypothetical protein